MKVLDEVQALRAQAEANAKQVRVEAKENYEAAMEAAGLAGRDGRRDFAVRLREAKKARDEARAAVPPPRTETAQNMRWLGMAGGGLIGNQLADPILNALGVSSPTGIAAASTAMTLAGIAAPMISQGGKAWMKNPGSISVPISGALAGQNALALPAAGPGPIRLPSSPGG